MSISSMTTFSEGGLVLHVFHDPHFIFDWSCAVLVIKFLRYGFATHRG